jgi:hypothetical protein
LCPNDIHKKIPGNEFPGIFYILYREGLIGY